MVKSSGVKTVPSDVFIQAYADHLRKAGELELPKWVEDVKTAKRRQMPPMDENWFYTRVASVARQMYIKPKGLGVGTLVRFYGGRTRGHHSKKHFSKSSRGIVRCAMQELVRLDLAEEIDEDDIIMKRLTSKGVKDMDTVANECDGSTGYVQDIPEYVVDVEEALSEASEDDVEAEEEEALSDDLE